MSKFLDLIAENTPADLDDLTDAVKKHVTKIFTSAGLQADYKTFQDVVTVVLSDGTKVVLEIKNLIPAEAEEVDGHEDGENTMDDLAKAELALGAAEKIKAAGGDRPSRGVKKIDRSSSNLQAKVAKTLDKIANELN